MYEVHMMYEISPSSPTGPAEHCAGGSRAKSVNSYRNEPRRIHQEQIRTPYSFTRIISSASYETDTSQPMKGQQWPTALLSL